MGVSIVVSTVSAPWTKDAARNAGICNRRSRAAPGRPDKLQHGCASHGVNHVNHTRISTNARGYVELGRRIDRVGTRVEEAPAPLRRRRLDTPTGMTTMRAALRNQERRRMHADRDPQGFPSHEEQWSLRGSRRTKLFNVQEYPSSRDGRSRITNALWSYPS
jgi:hypothetical protein